MSARYQHRKSARLCVDCAAGLQERDGVRCVECHERNADAVRSYYERGGNAVRAAWAKRRYHADPEAARAVRRLLYETRKLAGICQDCTFPAVDGAAYCLAHLEQRRIRARESMRRKRGVL